MKSITYRLGFAAALSISMASSAFAYDWLQFGGDPQHTGDNTAETVINANNVGRLIRKYQATMPGTSDNAPVFLQGVTTPGGTKDLLFMTTTTGTTFAVDAATGTQVWSTSFPAGTCAHNTSTQCYTTSAPAIDPSRNFIYAYGLEGGVHKLAVGTGIEVTTSPWPVTVSVKPNDEKNASALSFATSGGKTYLYVVAGGYPGDSGDYQGHITAINLANGSFKVFNTMCSNITMHIASGACPTRRSAVWSRPGVFYSAATNRIYFGTGNGTWNGVSNWSESVLAINPDGSATGTGPLDSFTPTSQQSLDNSDADLGATGPSILPVPKSSAIPNLAFQGGKDSLVRLLNLDNLSSTTGGAAPGHTGGEVGAILSFPPGGEIKGQPASWVDHTAETTWAFVANENGMAAYSLNIGSNGAPSLALKWSNTSGGWSPLVANDVLFSQRGGVKAYDPTTGTVLWSTSRINGQHWESPIVANGVLYAPDDSGNINAFANAGAGLRVDVHAGTGTTSNLNGILEPGESVLVEPVWRNVTTAAITSLTGSATGLSGPTGATYTVNDNAATYGAVAVNATGDCYSATPNCYRVTVSNPATRPSIHWDALLSETLSTGDTVMLKLHIGHSFPDVADTYAHYTYIERLVHNNVTIGFTDGTFQPDNTITRGATDIFVGRARVAPNGDSGITPGGKVGSSPYDCETGGVSLFTDVLPTDNFCKHVHQMAAAGINVAYGCGATNKACPAAVTTREVMSVLMAGSMAGSDASVPASGRFSDTGTARSYNCATGGTSAFPDVPVTSASCRHINYLWARGVVAGFTDGTFQPSIVVTRGQMAKFVANGQHLTLD